MKSTLTTILRRLGVFGFLLGMLCPPAHGQTGTITGTVTDSSGLPVPNVTVAITHKGTNARWQTAPTDGKGNYVGPLLPIGPYMVEVSLQGFQKAVRSVTLHVNKTEAIDLTLNPGNITDTVEVSGEASLVQSETAAGGNVIDNLMISELPVNGGRFEIMTGLVPGVTTNPSPSGAGFNVSSGGARYSSNNHGLDGVNNVEEIAGVGASGFNLRPIQAAIEEIGVLTHSFGAEHGRGGGANIQVTTKSGTNAFHGSVWNFLRNDNLDARGFFDVKKNEFRRSQFGGTLGGPIRKDRTFFFFAYEGIRRLQTVSSLQSVPSLEMRGGDINGVQIPASQWSPGAVNILKAYPLPTPGLTGTSNYLAVNSRIENTNQYNGRIDHHFNGSNRLSGRYSIVERRINNPCPGPGNTNCIPGFRTSVEERNQHMSLADTHTVSSRVVHELRAGFNRAGSGTIPFSSAVLGGSNTGAALGIPGLPSSTNPQDWGFPRVTFQDGLSELGDGGYANRYSTTFNVSNTVWVGAGSHSIRAGFEFAHQQSNAQGGRARDRLSFASFSNFLKGYLSQSVAFPLDFPRYRTTRTYAAFVQDDWRIRPNLTLNAGLRYDYQSPDREKYDRAVNINSHDYTIEFAGQNGASDALYEGDRRNFAPRLGFAYRPSTRLVVRGGYGVFFDIALQGAQLGPAKQGPPFFTDQTFRATSNPQDLTLSNPFPVGGAAQPQSVFDYRSIQTDFKNGYLQQWSFGVQESLRANMAVELGYIGSKGSRLYRLVDINQALPGSGALQSRRPLPQYGSVWMLQSQSSSVYHALISRVERRFSGGVALLAAYTWAHSIDDSSTANANTLVGQNARDLRAERASSDFDARHRLTASYVVAVPLGRARRFLGHLPPLAEAVFGGWQISGITTLQSGNPVNVVIQGPSRSGTGTTSMDRPNVTGIDPRLRVSDKRLYLNPAAYALQPVGTFGNAGRNSAPGPGLATTDLSIAKKFNRENWRFELRIELFNAFNHALLAQPNASANSPAFGQISAIRGDNRQIQFALKISR